MGIIKIGEAEEKIISEIERLKEYQKMRMENVLLGVKLARRQIPEAKDNATQAIVEQLDKTIKCVENLSKVIQGIKFSKEHDEEKFSISWVEVNDQNGTYFNYGYGNPIIGKPVTEKQFMFTLEAWDREVCKRLTLVKELEGRNPFESICKTIEYDIHTLVYVYAKDF